MLAHYKENGGYVYSDWIRQETSEAVAVTMTKPEDVLRKLPHSVTCLVPRAAFDAVGGFDTTIKAWEDWDFFIAVNAAGYYGSRIAAPLFYYRMNSGTRREAQYEQRETLKAEIYAKWKPYIEGEKQFMPCGGCGKKRPAPLPTVTAKAQPTVQSSEGEAVLLEFVPTNTPPMTFRGQVTGTLYRFGSDAGHKRKYVLTPDVQYLLARREFKRVTEPTADPVLEAATSTV
jgi:hypothetical protein